MANKFRTVYESPYNTGFNVNAFRKAAMQDPQFALGEIIGSALSGMYANNYNNRGISKAVSKALDSYGTGSNVADDQAALQQVQQNMLQPGNDSVGVGVSDMEALNNVRQNYGLDAIQPAGPAISAGAVPQQDPQALTAQIAQMPGAGIVARENGARRIEDFDPEVALMNARQQMLKDGRTPYQIEMAMEQLKPQFARMQDDAYRAQTDRIMAELGQGDISDADYKQRIVELARLGDYGKNAANVYGKDIITGRERWNAQQQEAKENRMLGKQIALQDARDARRYAQQVELKKMDAANKLAVARERAKLYGTDNTVGQFGNKTKKTNGTVKSALDSAEFKYMDTQINKIAETPEEERTPEQKRFYDQFKPLRDQIVAQSFGSQFDYHTPEERGANANSVQTSFNPNNYDQAVPFFKEFAKRGNFRKEDIAKYIRQRYYGLKPDDTSNEFVEAIIREL